jgi:hypothetical protein
MLIRLKLDRLLIILRSAVIKMTERAVILSSDYKFFALTFHHNGLDTVSAGSFTATIQDDGLSILEIKEMLADGAF